MESDYVDKSNTKDSEEQAVLNKLIEEYQLIISKKNVYINRGDILKDIFITVSNRLEVDPFITDKMHFKKRRGEEGCCSLI